jgi:hypothetical protein
MCWAEEEAELRGISPMEFRAQLTAENERARKNEKNKTNIKCPSPETQNTSTSAELTPNTTAKP